MLFTLFVCFIYTLSEPCFFSLQELFRRRYHNLVSLQILGKLLRRSHMRLEETVPNKTRCLAFLSTDYLEIA